MDAIRRNMLCMEAHSLIILGKALFRGAFSHAFKKEGVVAMGVLN